MAISGGPRRLAGLQRTRRPMQMRPRSQLAAAQGEGRLRDPARRRSHLGPGGPAARRGHSSGPGAAGAGRGGRAAQGAGGKLWRRPRGAVSAGAPGSPLYRESAPPPAPRARAPPPPGRPSRSERPRAGLRPGAFVSPARSGASPPALRARKAGRRAGSAPPRRVWLGAPAALGLRCPRLRTVSPLRARVPSAGSAGDRPAPTLAAGAERSAHAGVAGLRQDQLSESSRFPACVLSPDSNCVSFTKQQLLGSRKAQENQRKEACRSASPPKTTPAATFVPPQNNNNNNKTLKNLQDRPELGEVAESLQKDAEEANVGSRRVGSLSEEAGARLPRSLLAPTAPTPPPRLLCMVLERLSEVPPVEASLRPRPSICNSKPSDCRGVAQGVSSVVREGAAGSAWRCGGQWLTASGRERRTCSCPGPPCPV
ncbi:serine/arginine repetitive matrix protein 1-like [Lontra canadensis]|uniref:serine/arginine repetitive matrix protein 1-like n=1 Tax=Lontra canadensis TaxID=76717 RepID=UPI0013F36C54|nr:serine/arginine repetitive matrix protein 1-like [Lontra canadensis]